MLPGFIVYIGEAEDLKEHLDQDPRPVTFLPTASQTLHSVSSTAL